MPYNPLMSHGQCWLWDSRLVFSHSIGDLLIWLAYMIIPILIGSIYVRGRLFDYTLAYPKLWKLGGAFIFFCSLTHLSAVGEIWIGGWVYYLSGIIKLLTAIVSLLFAWELYRLREEFIFISKVIFSVIHQPQGEK